MPPILAHLPPDPHPLIVGDPMKDWLSIRRRRAEGAGRATEGDRRSIFSSALEQAEELFRAAATVDKAVRPIMLFYGMSQASRAIAACATSISDDGWLLKGHGLQTDGLDSFDIGDVELKPGRFGTRSNFGTMQRLLAGEQWAEPVALRDVWEATPLLQHLGRPPMRPSLPIQVGPAATGGPEMVGRVTIRGIPERLLGDPPSADYFDFLSTIYPTLRLTSDYVPAQGDGYPDRELLGPTDGFFTLRRSTPIGADYETARNMLGVGGQMVPGLGDASRPPSEFTLWWAVLYALSMRARYQPDRWRHDLDVDSNSHAVPLQATLSGALVRCPMLIDMAIGRAATTTPP